MCVHMQKPFEPGQAHFITGRPISSHRSRRDIFGLGLSSMTLFVFFGPSVS
jgi:hypothetical protein